MQKYNTKDFYLAAYLVMKDQMLYGTDHNNNITLFEFENNSNLKKLIGQYYSLRANVEPMAYGNSIRTLKSIIWASKSNSKSEKLTNVKQNREILCNR
jgi:uncharacterized protein DUF5659